MAVQIRAAPMMVVGSGESGVSYRQRQRWKTTWGRAGTGWDHQVTEEEEDGYWAAHGPVQAMDPTSSPQVTYNLTWGRACTTAFWVKGGHGGVLGGKVRALVSEYGDARVL